MNAVLQYIVFLAVLLLLAVPLGTYISKVMDGQPVFLTPVLRPLETLVYTCTGVRKEESMDGKTYLASVLCFAGASFVVLFVMLSFQDILPLNPQHIRSMDWHLAFNTAVSFVTNTNWQAYSGESAVSYFSQSIGLTTQNFVSAATGIAVLYALIRAFAREKETGLGNFWVDLTRASLYILLPLSMIVSIVLVSQGVVQNFQPARMVQLAEPVAADRNGHWIEGAAIDLAANTVTVDGKKAEDAVIVAKQFVPMGPAASQVAIKQIGTNGGGFFGANSAHPLENPNGVTNFVECIAILLIPVALCFAFGRSVRKSAQGRALCIAMACMLVFFLALIGCMEQAATPQLAQHNAVNITAAADQAGGNMEGKEARFGIAQSAAWTA